MTENKAIENAYNTQNYLTTYVSIIDPVNPMVPIAAGRIKTVKTDLLGFPLSVTITLENQFREDESDSGLREVPFVDVYQAHVINLN